MTIYALEHPLRNVFSPKDYQFKIPEYQRPYAWTNDQAEEFWNDLINALDQKEEEEPEYFLGSMVLVKSENKPEAEVVDGQQRLTTLTILFAVIRHHLSPSSTAYSKIENLFFEEDFDGQKRPGLTTRKQDNQFFADNIYTPGGIENLIKQDSGFDSDSQIKMRDNAIFFDKQLKNKLKEISDQDKDQWLTKLLGNILKCCHLVVVSTNDFEKAYRIFSTINSRGLNLTHNDILKAEIISKMDDGKKRKEYTEIWDSMEGDLGRSQFESLFAYIFRIEYQERPSKSILTEYRKRVLPKYEEKYPKDHVFKFVDELLLPSSKVLEIINNQNFECEDLEIQDSINNYLGWLNLIDNDDWKAPLISFMIRYRNESTKLLKFLVELERYAAAIMFLRFDINARARAYRPVILATLESAGEAIDTLEKALDIEKQDELIKKVLEGDIYKDKTRRKYILLRLDSALAESGQSESLKSKTLTIEHVLPQSLTLEWKSLGWNEENHAIWVNRLGNLALLSQKKNSSGSNLSFEIKKKEYFQKKGSVTFPITTRILSYSTWTPAIVEQNQNFYIKTLKKVWRLSLM
ncbi:slr7024 (plasmid) [Synechocystis sp. PCC 6803]|uniref:Slr7024 protein n=1 Tax=Synechocystis sp. (strain ATCC 27184 / PCC 6803 / Kazusa) TaxID=1111708 RepID=Q6ZEH4_SYNY3|nr:MULTISPECIES: DUF262 domain-containing protein [unclassified Synechocystis]AGF53578.1 hypothetical protein MYO_4220 [Synechocystis sp. PCC 6803]AVP91432.1 DUF262 domain-containing protein [Synechocystis sp. IPPAS B-1465]MBD2618942.1 DUF262 domain-containing protein [Synechocystis sp. FACHB-898]MBD2637433.1 DUF262 domain-containing protein [Synechocystis sp. FACHB-908]MBD2661548.1 DUF262 domain-containing protein [Synechocystis sp. FACHB-929]